MIDAFASRRRALLALGFGACVWPFGAYAQQRKKLPVVGVLHPGMSSLRAPIVVALKEGLRDLGYVEGQTIALELRHAHQLEGAREAAAELSFGPDLPTYWGRIAPLIDKILKGVKPGSIPIERPTKFELVVNRRAAKAIGINVPPTVLIRADRVI